MEKVFRLVAIFRKLSLLPTDMDHVVRNNGFNYWYFSHMLGPYHGPN